MEQKYEEDLFKILKLRKKRKNIQQANKVSLLIDPQILQASQVINANQSQSNNRIKHKSTSIQQAHKNTIQKKDSRRQKWQISLSAYIQAKSKIHDKQKKHHTITFFNLDRLNRNRYERQLNKQFASLKISRHIDQYHRRSQRDSFKPKVIIYHGEQSQRIHSERVQQQIGSPKDQGSKNYSKYGQINSTFMKTYFKRRPAKHQLARRHRNIQVSNPSFMKSNSLDPHN